ncbi:MAG: HisA/HisF-related TIM barrel protein [Candidatus Kapabacteria bacterium]|nr:HisA/HisF-related TIM barrel protein [Candidatus Kapabacteria bacterium]
MLLVIPAIEMRNGICFGCIQGEAGTSDYYQELFENPLLLVKLMREENSKALHVYDYDSFHSDESTSNLKSILNLSQNFDIPIQLHTKYIDANHCKMLLDSGIYRLIINELNHENLQTVASLLKSYSPSRIVFWCELDQQNNLVDKDGRALDDYLKQIQSIGGKRIVVKYTDRLFDDSCYEFTKELYRNYHMKISLYEGVYEAEDLIMLNKDTTKGIDSVIMSESLYQNCFPCQKIWRLAESKLMN